jgi:hypothetical protein
LKKIKVVIKSEIICDMYSSLPFLIIFKDVIKTGKESCFSIILGPPWGREG